MSTSSSLNRFVVISSLLVSGVALAEDQRPVIDGGLQRGPSYVWTPGAAVPPGTQGVTSRIVFLHRCPEISGCMVRGGGTSDSRTDTSTIADGIRQLGEFSHGDAVWAATVDCVKTTFAPFDIMITDQDPGDVPHFEAMFGGQGSDLDGTIGGNVLGLSPFNCGEIPNSIVFIFDANGSNPENQCATAAQEIAHSFGLEHEFLQKDPMTYLAGDLPKRFRDETVPCGELAVNDPSCKCGAAMQNSYRKIVALFGPGLPTPPDVLFKRLTEGKQVQPGFTAVIDAQDDVRVEKVELFIDGAMVGTATMPVGNDFEIETPADLASGDHVLEARATDVQGIVGTTTISVVMGPPCTPSKGCTGDDVCVDGVCIPGPDEPGGLGSICQRDTECLSHQCADAGEAQKHCVESCGLSNPDSCPNNFECIAAGADGVCWPSGGGGCCDTNRRGNAHGPLLLGLGVMIVLVRRRRRR